MARREACCKLCRWERSDKEGVCLPNFLIVNERPIYESKVCVGDYEDSAKFEALVAKELTAFDYEDVPCAHGMGFFCPKPPFAGKDCTRWCLLREARLKAERMM